MFVAKIQLSRSADREAGRRMTVDETAEEAEEEAWIDLMKLGSVFSHEGSNLYLRLWQLGQFSAVELIVNIATLEFVTNF